jgi:hypothetical protein
MGENKEGRYAASSLAQLPSMAGMGYEVASADPLFRFCIDTVGRLCRRQANSLVNSAGSAFSLVLQTLPH